MLKRFLVITALSATSAFILVPTLFSAPDSTQALAQVTSVSQLSDVQPATNEIRKVYKGFISSEKVDVLRKRPGAVLKRSGIRVKDNTQIKVVSGNDDNSAKRRKVIVIITDTIIIIIIT
ncbi:MAG: hypothetical protein QNJ63_26085 [Calothrix sp. MO_192.B10]|nr:hypothetical protein [Calothrix sp. MO_192.B10]